MSGPTDLLVPAVATAAALAGVVGCALAGVRLAGSRRRRLEPKLRVARAAMIAIVASADRASGRSAGSEAPGAPGTGTPSGVLSGAPSVARDWRARHLARLSVLTSRQLMAIALDLSSAFGGDSLAALGALADELGLVATARAQLHSRSLVRRLAAARFLTAINPPSAQAGRHGTVGGDELSVLLGDRDASVRLLGTAWAINNPNPAAVTGLVAMLDDRDGLCRFAAKDGLIRMGLAAAPAIVAILDQEWSHRVEAALEIAVSMADARFTAPATRLAESPVPRARALAVAVLGAVADPAGVPVIERRLDDEDPSVRVAAAVALGSIGHWPAAPRIARLLGDPSWPVRREAGFALLRLGAPGRLMLNEARAAGAPAGSAAAEMATQVIEVAGLNGAGVAGRGGAEVAGVKAAGAAAA